MSGIDLSKTDEELVRQNNEYSKFSNSHRNPITYQHLLDGIYRLREKLQNYDNLNEFESLWRENALHDLEAQEILVHQLYGKPTMTLPEMMEVTHGPGSYAMFEDMLRNPDYAYNVRKQEIIGKLLDRRANPHSPDVEKFLNNAVIAIQSELLKYGIEEGFIPDDHGLRVIYNTHVDRTHFDSGNGAVYVGPEDITAYYDGALKIRLAEAYSVLSHELLGHGSNKANSRLMPVSMRFDGKVRSIQRKVVSEGLACVVQRDSCEFMRQNKDRLNIQEDEINDIEINHGKLDDYTNMTKYMIAVLHERQRFEGLDLEKHLEEFKLSPRLKYEIIEPYKSGRAYTDGHVVNLISALGELTYAPGFALVSYIKAKHKDADPRKLRKAMATGHWSWKVYPKAVEYFLRQSA